MTTHKEDSVRADSFVVGEAARVTGSSRAEGDQAGAASAASAYKLFCEFCGEPFEAKRPDAKTCSDACRAKLSRRKRDPGIGSAERKARQRSGLDKRYAERVHADARFRLFPRVGLKAPSGPTRAADIYHFGERHYWQRESRYWLASDGWWPSETMAGVRGRASYRRPPQGPEFAGVFRRYSELVGQVRRREGGEVTRQVALVLLRQAIDAERIPQGNSSLLVQGLLWWRDALAYAAEWEQEPGLSLEQIEVAYMFEIWEQEPGAIISNGGGSCYSVSAQIGGNVNKEHPPTVVERLTRLERFKAEVERQLGLPSEDEIERFVRELFPEDEAEGSRK